MVAVRTPRRNVKRNVQFSISFFGYGVDTQTLLSGKFAVKCRDGCADYLSSNKSGIKSVPALT